MVKGFKNLIVRVCEMRGQLCQIRNLDCKDMKVEGVILSFAQISNIVRDLNSRFLSSLRLVRHTHEQKP